MGFFESPYIVGELSFAAVFGIGERCFVITPSVFEVSLCHTIVIFRREVLSRYSGFIDYTLCKTVSIERAFIRLSAIAFILCWGVVIQNFGVMGGDDRRHIVHGAVRNLNCISVE